MRLSSIERLLMISKEKDDASNNKAFPPKSSKDNDIS